MQLSIITNDVMFVVFLEHAVEGRENRFIADVDQFWKCLAKCCSCFLQVVVRYLGEKMVDLVCADTAKENKGSQINL